MAKKEAEVHGIRIKETRADRTFNVLNLIFWMIVLFITLYPLWLVLIASVSDPDAVLAGEVIFCLRASRSWAMRRFSSTASCGRAT